MSRLILYGSGILMFIFEMVWFFRWWDVGGLMAAVFIPPLAIAFPFVFLVKEGFSLLYFGLWGAGLAAAAMETRDDMALRA
jgi:hypothetical protein